MSLETELPIADVVSLPIPQRRFSPSHFIPTIFNQVKTGRQINEQQGQRKRKSSFGRRIVSSIALAVPLVASALGGQEVATVAQRTLLRQDIEHTPLENVILDMHSTSQHPVIPSSGIDCEDSSTFSPYVRFVYTSTPANTLWTEHESNNIENIRYVSPENQDTKQLDIERTKDGQVTLRVDALQTKSKKPDDAYFMFQTPQKLQLLVQAENGKLILNPLDTDPTDRVVFADGSSMQRGEFSQMVDNTTPARRLSVEVDAVTAQIEKNGKIDLTQLAGKNGDSTFPATVPVLTEAITKPYEMSDLEADSCYTLEQPVVPHPQEPLSPIPFAALAGSLELVYMLRLQKEKKKDVSSPTDPPLHQLNEIISNVGDYPINEVAQNIQALLEYFEVKRKISANVLSNLKTSDHIKEYVYGLIAEARAEKQIQEIISQRGIGTMVRKFRDLQQEKIKPGYIPHNFRLDALSHLLSNVLTIYIPLQFPKSPATRQQLSEFTKRYRLYLFDPSEENLLLAEEAYQTLLKTLPTQKDPLDFQTFSKKFLRKRAYISTIPGLLNPEDTQVFAITPQRRKEKKQLYLNEELEALMAQGDERSRRRDRVRAT